ncbi:hypothetical protein HZC30_06295 [Candidatus Woesearchaeota archaeon]|nr:hypothetical protein [Candidatus Woesearchaeota archaeon]
MDKKKVIERRNPKRISSQRDFYQKLAVVGIIVLIVLGIFFLAGLKGVGKASYTPSDKEVYIEGNSKKAVDDSDYCGPDSGDDECKDNCGDSTKWCYSTLKDLCYPTNSIIKGEGSANWVQNDDLSYSYGFGYTTDDKIAALCDPAGEGSFPPGYAWVFCTGSIKKTVYKEKFYCSNGGQWFPCTGEKDPTGKLINDEIIKDEKHLCVASSKKWMTCDEKLDKKDWLKLDGLFLCRGSYWDKCDSDSKGVSTTKVYYCSKDSGKWKWKECANTKLSADLTQLCQQEGTTWKWKNCTKDGLTIGSYYCKTKGGVWAELGAGDVVASGKLDSCNVTDTGIHSGNSSKYCNGINWTDCTTANKFTLSTDGKAYCGNCSSTCKWSTCNSSLNKERYPAGDKAPNQYQFLCDDTQQKWLTCDASTTPNLLFSSGSSKDQFYCSYKGDHFQWQKCNSTKTTPDLISGDNTKICKKVSNKEQWVSSTKVGMQWNCLERREMRQ